MRKQFKQKMFPHNWVKRWKITMLTVIILKGEKITFFPTNFNCCLMIPSQQLLEPVCNSRDGWNRNSDRITKIRKSKKHSTICHKFCYGESSSSLPSNAAQQLSSTAAKSEKGIKSSAHRCTHRKPISVRFWLTGTRCKMKSLQPPKWLEGSSNLPSSSFPDVKWNEISFV